ncbi:hypothetical protein CVT24_011850 [Panaeolus cyanescens]|uniref:Ras-GEF domain-containing protein n=1 Tax=Panaeolus cyanescens TaxID=181874 RepID=A0A409YNQ4_9AGAR|nr:hypothetical protein CVT24_011850 [Panaeolus cyanescens]
MSRHPPAKSPGLPIYLPPLLPPGPQTQTQPHARGVEPTSRSTSNNVNVNSGPSSTANAQKPIVTKSPSKPPAHPSPSSGLTAVKPLSGTATKTAGGNPPISTTTPSTSQTVLKPPISQNPASKPSQPIPSSNPNSRAPMNPTPASATTLHSKPSGGSETKPRSENTNQSAAIRPPSRSRTPAPAPSTGLTTKPPPLPPKSPSHSRTKDTEKGVNISKSTPQDSSKSKTDAKATLAPPPTPTSVPLSPSARSKPPVSMSSSSAAAKPLPRPSENPRSPSRAGPTSSPSSKAVNKPSQGVSNVRPLELKPKDNVVNVNTEKPREDVRRKDDVPKGIDSTRSNPPIGNLSSSTRTQFTPNDRETGRTVKTEATSASSSGSRQQERMTRTAEPGAERGTSDSSRSSPRSKQTAAMPPATLKPPTPSVSQPAPVKSSATSRDGSSASHAPKAPSNNFPPNAPLMQSHTPSSSPGKPTQAQSSQPHIHSPSSSQTRPKNTDRPQPSTKSTSQAHAPSSSSRLKEEIKPRHQSPSPSSEEEYGSDVAEAGTAYDPTPRRVEKAPVTHPSIKPSSSKPASRNQSTPPQASRQPSKVTLLKKATTRPLSADESFADSETSTMSVAGGSEYTPSPKFSARLHKQFPSLQEHLENVRKATYCTLPSNAPEDLDRAARRFHDACRKYFYQYREVSVQVLIVCQREVHRYICDLLALSFFSRLVMGEDTLTLDSAMHLRQYFVETCTHAERIYETLEKYYCQLATTQKAKLHPDDVTDGGGLSMIVDDEEEEEEEPRVPPVPPTPSSGSRAINEKATSTKPPSLATHATPPSHVSSLTLVPSLYTSRRPGPAVATTKLDPKVVARALEKGDVQEILSVMIPDPNDVSGRIDEDLWEIFLTLYQFFVVKRSEFFPALVQRFNDLEAEIQSSGPKAGATETDIRRDAYQRRILRFLTLWLNTDSCFDSKLTEVKWEVAQEFKVVEEFMRSHEKHQHQHRLKEMFGHLRKLIDERKLKSEEICGIQMVAPWISVEKPVIPSDGWKSGPVETVLKRFRDWHSNKKEQVLVANRLTALVASLFREATSIGLMRFWDWEKKVKEQRSELPKREKHDQCEALMVFIRRLQVFVTYSILDGATGSPSTVSERASMIAFWLGVASACLDHGDLSSAGTIFLGIDTVSVRRLSKTIPKVTFSGKRQYHKLSEYFGGGSSNSRTYMTHFEEARKRDAFFIPFLSMHSFRVKMEVNPKEYVEKKKEIYSQTMSGILRVTKSECPFPLQETFNGWLYSALISVAQKGSLEECEALENKFYNLSKTLEPTSIPLAEQDSLWRYEDKEKLKFVGVFRRPQELAGMLSKLQKMLLEEN